jgi:hypothetical protein
MTPTLTARPLAILLAALISLTGFGALADSHEPPPQGALESFMCSFIDGKDRDDLNSAIEYHLKQAEKAGIATPPAYLWTKVKGNAPVDMVWHNAYESMAAFAAQLDAEAASSEMTAVNERYLSVVDCTPMLGRVSAIQQRGETNGGEGNFVVAYACRTHQAPDRAAFGDLHRHISGVTGAMGDTAPIATYAIAPVTSDPDGPNAVYFNVFENLTHWAAFDGQLAGSESGQMLLRHFGTMMSCSTNMWASEQVIGSAE